ncbi:hypothetical protein BGZ73_001052 [Actinomortierella ambigua]|nr:hypothetical protein BGZ73_001052 [Actinomortierella ambigua]
MQDGWRNDVGDRAGILELHECTRDMAVTLEQLATLCCCHISQNMDEAHVSPYGFYLPHGAGLLTLLFDHIDKTPCVDSLWSALLTSILEQTSQPYCDMLSRWLGITPESNHYESTGGVAASTTAPRTRDAPTTFQFGDHIHRHLQGLDSFSEFFVQSKSEWVFEGSHPLLLPDGHYELSNGFDELAREGSGLKSWDGEFQLNPLCPPAAFITGDLAQKVLEAGKALQMMLEYDAQHPLSFSSGTPPFRWVFSQKELRDDRQQREVQRRVVMSRMVDRLRSKGVLTDKLQSMDLDPSNHGAPISPGDDGRMHVELPGLLHTNTLEFPGSEALDMAWNPFGHRGELGAFFNYSTYPDETSVAAKDKSCIHTMETLLSTANAQDENVQLHQQQEYALLPMVVLAQECISYPLQAHAELIDTCFVSFFIHDLHLLDHWRIMGRFMLMRDGIFVTLLSEALFDDESGFIQQQLTKASERGHLRSRSGHKMDVPWPPRSGELEAALRMVLLDAFQSTDSASSLQADVLDETLAFAVKDYSEDVAICRDVHAMEAFDFLYLEYRSPGPVQMLILQPHVMEKYTRLFTFHLRLLRVHASMRQCFRHLKTLSRISLDAKGDRRPKRRLPGLQVKDLQCLQQFRFEAEQVLEGLRGYLFDTAVGVNWSQFMQRMEAIKSRVEARLIVEGAANAGPMHRATTPLHTLQHQAGDPRSAKGGDGDETSGRDDDDDFDCTNGSMDSISAIREAHEQMLEQILVQALLKRKQRPVLKVVHEVLGCMVQLCKNVRELLQILEVAANVQGDDWSDDEQMESEEGEDRDEVEQGVAVQEIMQRVQAQYERFRSTCTMLARVLKALDGSMAAGSSSASAQMHGEKQASFLQQLLVRLGWMSERDVAK